MKFGNIKVSPKISVIIVTYKTNLELKDCLDSLNTQTFKNFEVIVIDNDHEDVNMLNKYSIKYYRLDKNYGPSYARNYGAKKAAGALLAFLDDDAIADESWLLNIYNAFKDLSVVALRGKLALKSKNTFYNSLPWVYDLGNSLVDSPIHTEGNSAVRRKDFLAIGGFNTKLYGQEGVDLSHRLKNHGKQLYVPNVVIFHDAGDSLGHFLKREYRSGYNAMLRLQKYPEIASYSSSFTHLTKSKHKRSLNNEKKILNFIFSQLAKMAFHIGSITYRIRIILLKGNIDTHIK